MLLKNTAESLDDADIRNRNVNIEPWVLWYDEITLYEYWLIDKFCDKRWLVNPFERPLIDPSWYHRDYIDGYRIRFRHYYNHKHNPRMDYVEAWDLFKSKTKDTYCLIFSVTSKWFYYFRYIACIDFWKKEYHWDRQPEIFHPLTINTYDRNYSRKFY